MHISISRACAALAILAGAIAMVGCDQSTKTELPKPPQLTATIETDKGTMEVELLPDVAPKTVHNFVLLAQRGYYDGLQFFRVVKDFMVQTGDPENTGKGGKSAWGGTFEDEIDPHSALYQNGYKRGSLAMANSGPNSNQSQFFIVQTDFPLPPGYTIFGRVIKGFETLDALVSVPTERGFDGGMSKPTTPPVMKKVTIHGTLPAIAANAVPDAVAKAAAKK